jgi:Domain of unknown function DUF302
LFRIIDHSGTAEGVGVQMPDLKLVMFGNPTKGAAVMLAAPVAALDLPLNFLVWEDGNGVVSVTYNSPGFTAERLHIEGALRAPFDAVESTVQANVLIRHHAPLVHAQGLGPGAGLRPVTRYPPSVMRMIVLPGVRRSGANAAGVSASGRSAPTIGLSRPSLSR